MVERQRETWIDLARAVGIIAVVVGHYLPGDDPTQIRRYIYWWHMPLFFMLSGYVFRPPRKISVFWDWMASRARRLLIPYLSFLLVITAVRWAERLVAGGADLSWFLQDAYRLALGGRHITFSYAVFWFVPCLFVAQLVAGLVWMLRPGWFAITVAAALSFALAHLQTNSQLRLITVPWSVDTALLAFPYLVIGMRMRGVFPTSMRPAAAWMAAALPVCLLMLYLDRSGRLGFYYLEMKSMVYFNPLLDLILPLSFGAVLCSAAVIASCTRWQWSLAERIGRESMLVMYLHLPLNFALQHFISYGLPVYLVVGAAIPFALSYTPLMQSRWAQTLFLGTAPIPSP